MEQLFDSISALCFNPFLITNSNIALGFLVIHSLHSWYTLIIFSVPFKFKLYKAPKPNSKLLIIKLSYKDFCLRNTNKPASIYLLCIQNWIFCKCTFLALNELLIPPTSFEPKVYLAIPDLWKDIVFSLGLKVIKLLTSGMTLYSA